MHTSFRHHLPKRLILCAAVLGITALTACGKGSAPADSAATSGTMGESATDLAVNLAQLVAQNPDIFGWLYIPETPVDAPLLQSMTGEDTWYLTHDCTGAESATGAMFIEAGNLLDMCDFNTIVNGYGGKGGCFESLWQFADADYFAGHEQFYIVIDGNALTYEIWTAYEREDTSLLRSYDLTSEEGCTAYLADMQKEQVAGRAHIRPGWEEGVSADNFLVTLTATDSAKPGRQFIVQGCLIDDQAGTIRR